LLELELEPEFCDETDTEELLEDLTSLPEDWLDDDDELLLASTLRVASDKSIPRGAATTDPARAAMRGRTATLNNILSDRKRDGAV